MHHLTGLTFILLALILQIIPAACAQKWQPVQDPEPVRNYTRDLSDGTKYYIVRPGDTLYSIGFRSGNDYRLLAEWNEIAPPYTINVGQVIKLFKPENTPAVQSVRNPPQRRKTGDSVKFQNSAQPADSDNPNAKKRTASQKKLSIISDNKKKVLKLYWQWPLKGKLLKTFTQTGRKGIDIFAEEGASVRSSSSGKVVYSGQGLIGYGNLLIIKHNEQFLSAYGNNRKLLVSEGQFVEGGQVIAEVGVGSDKKPSLHFEIRKYGKPVNPLLYLPK